MSTPSTATGAAEWPDSPALILDGDCLDRLRDLPDASIDAIVTDPPYGLSELSSATITAALTAWIGGDRGYTPSGAGFMGKTWDAFVPPPAVWDECFRVLKPGGHLLAFSGSRTYDLMGISIRLAGFEIRDGVAWLNGQGFPKSFDISKGIDKAAGAQREIIGTRTSAFGDAAESETDDGRNLWGKSSTKEVPLTGGPVTENARRWDGWGTALKPSFEPVVVARKPLEGTVVANVLKYGVGGINVDATRIKSGPSSGGSSSGRKGTREAAGGYGHDRVDIDREMAKGRWPANAVIGHAPDCRIVGTASDTFGGGAKATSGFVDGYEHDGFHGTTVDVDVWDCGPGCQVAELNRQSGVTTSVPRSPTGKSILSPDAGWNANSMTDATVRGFADSGGASRFFYTPKASRGERPEVNGVKHPTVKPLALLRWLVRLVVPEGGVVLDPFAGSGTTIEAALLEHRRVIGIEREPDYLPLIAARVARVSSPGPADADDTLF